MNFWRCLAPMHGKKKDFQCVTGWRVPSVNGPGVKLRRHRRPGRPEQGDRRVEFTSYDGVYTESLTLEPRRTARRARRLPDAEGPISADHGGPVRLTSRPMYGYKSCKWLKVPSQLVPAATPGFWEQTGLRRRSLDRTCRMAATTRPSTEGDLVPIRGRPLLLASERRCNG